MVDHPYFHHYPHNGNLSRAAQDGGRDEMRSGVRNGAEGCQNRGEAWSGGENEKQGGGNVMTVSELLENGRGRLKGVRLRVCVTTGDGGVRQMVDDKFGEKIDGMGVVIQMLSWTEGARRKTKVTSSIVVFSRDNYPSLLLPQSIVLSS